LINLVKNELVKIFHKKGIFILSGIIVGIMTLSVILSKIDLNTSLISQGQDLYYEYLEEGLNKYDLTNREDITWYVEELADLEEYKLTKDLDYSSPEYYYVSNNIREALIAMYNAKYLNKNEEEYKVLKEEYDKLISGIKDYDWENAVSQEKEETLKEIKELKEKMSHSEDEELEEYLKDLEVKLEAIEYRLRNKVAPAYTNSSSMVDNYLSAAAAFRNLKSDDNGIYKDRRELIQRRETISNYHVLKYKIEHDIIEDENALKNEAENIFSQVDMFILIAFLLIAGGIIAEEFNKGTIKQLLLRPFTRNKILISKMIAALIATFIFACFYYICDLLAVAIMNNEFKSIFDSIIVYNFNKESIVEYSTFIYCILQLLATLPEYLMLFAICIFVGILTTNTIACVVSVFGVTFLHGILSSFLPEKIMAYLPTGCLNFNSFLFGGISANQYQTLGSNIAVYIITFTIIIGLSFMIFNKKDIKNQ